MSLKFLALFASTLVSAHQNFDGYDAERVDWKGMVDSVNLDTKSTWKARVPSEVVRDMYAYTLKGALLPYTSEETIKYQNFSKSNVFPPASFDARTAFPNCASIQSVRDQCGCGSCFAFGAVEAFEDRICIHNKKNVTLSVEDIISCHTDENMSCDGGNPIAVWENIFAGKSEGDGAIQDACYSYQIKPCPCNHHSNTSSLPVCTPEGSGNTPQCDFSLKFDCEDKGIFRSETPVLIQASDMEEEIYTNGPITVAYTVFDDFFTYSSGIYQKSPNAQPLGGHSVKIVGYGVENGVKYWTVANSWNTEFGEGGFFRIVRGEDECGIESMAVVAGMPLK